MQPRNQPSSHRSPLEKHWSSTTHTPKSPRRSSTQIYHNLWPRRTCSSTGCLIVKTIRRTGHSGPLVTSNKPSSSSRTTFRTGRSMSSFSLSQTIPGLCTPVAGSPFPVLVRCTSSCEKHLRVTISHRLVHRGHRSVRSLTETLSSRPRRLQYPTSIMASVRNGPTLSGSDQHSTPSARSWKILRSSSR